MIAKDNVAVWGANPEANIYLMLTLLNKPGSFVVFENVRSLRETGFFFRLGLFKKRADKKFVYHVDGLAAYGSLWYETVRESTDLAEAIFPGVASRNKALSFYKRYFRSEKWEAFLKRWVCHNVFTLFKQLHLIRMNGGSDICIYMVQDPISKQVIDHFQNKYSTRFRIKYIKPFYGLTLFYYYIKIVINIFQRGLDIGRKRQRFLLSKEAAWGLTNKAMRDDILIDGDKFKKEDIVFWHDGTNDKQITDTLRSLQLNGYHTVDISKLKIQLGSNIGRGIYFYFLAPLFLYFQCLFECNAYLFFLIPSFQLSVWPWEIFLNKYEVKVNVSLQDWNGVPETLIFNKYHAGNVIFHWSDMTSFPFYNHALTAFNTYFVWGPIHYEWQGMKKRYDDEVVPVGCVFNDSYRAVVNQKRSLRHSLGLSENDRIVAFFDNSCNDEWFITTKTFFSFVDMVLDYAKKHVDVKVIIKPKKRGEWGAGLKDSDKKKYVVIQEKYGKQSNLTFLDALEWSIEKVMLISDVCVGMGMTSAGTLALILGKESLYFDDTDNQYHPFSKKYRGKFIFSEKEGLIRKIDEILYNNVSVRTLISDEELRRFDSIPESGVINRIRTHLYNKYVLH